MAKEATLIQDQAFGTPKLISVGAVRTVTAKTKHDHESL